MLVFPSRSGTTAPGDGGEPSAGTSSDATGTISFYISDQRNARDADPGWLANSQKTYPGLRWTDV